MPELPLSFGDVTNEYVTLRDHAGLVEGLHELVWVQGEDTVTFLQGILSQDVASPQEGEVVRTLLLQPNGKLAAVAWMMKGAAEVGLVVDAGLGEEVAGTLNRYRIRVKAAVTLEQRTLREVWGRSASDAVREEGLPVPSGWERTAAGTIVASIPLGSLPRYLVVGEAIEAPPVGTLAATALRVEAGEPVMGRDLSTSTIPQETGLVDASVSFTKGCYLGQELVARIDTRGHVNRRLMGIVLRANVIPPEGASIQSGGKEIGELTSPVESLTMRAPIGLGLIRREIEAGSDVEVHWDGGRAAGMVQELPFSKFGEV